MAIDYSNNKTNASGPAVMSHGNAWTGNSFRCYHGSNSICCSSLLSAENTLLFDTKYGSWAYASNSLLRVGAYQLTAIPNLKVALSN